MITQQTNSFRDGHCERATAGNSIGSIFPSKLSLSVLQDLKKLQTRALGHRSTHILVMFLVMIQTAYCRSSVPLADACTADDMLVKLFCTIRYTGYVSAVKVRLCNAQPAQMVMYLYMTVTTWTV